MQSLLELVTDILAPAACRQRDVDVVDSVELVEIAAQLSVKVVV